MLRPLGQNWSADVPQELESRPGFYARVSQPKSRPVSHISGNFDPGRSLNTIERSQSVARRGPNHQYHGMSGGPRDSSQQERHLHSQKQPTNSQGRARPTKFNNRIPLPRPPYDVHRNQYLTEEYEPTTFSNRARPYLASIPNTGSGIHFSDRSYNKNLLNNVYPTSRFQMREPPLDDDSWRSAMMPPPEMPPYPYSMPLETPYHAPSVPLAPVPPTPHREATQDDQDDIEIILGPKQRSSSAFASAGASEYADKGRDRLREQLEFYFSPSNLAVDKFLVSHMNAERYVPISVIADFKRVKAVTRNMDEIVAALRRSSAVTVDETGTMVKPIPAKPRTTLIIRDLPHDIEAKEISDFFEAAKCPAKEIVKEVGNTLFVEFKTPEEALAMLLYIRGKTLRGVPLAGRLKSNTAFTGGIKSTVLPNRPTEQTASPTELNEYGPTLDGGWISSLSDTIDYSSPVRRPTYRRFPLEPEEYSPYCPHGSWLSAAAEFPFNNIPPPTNNPIVTGTEITQQGHPLMPITPDRQHWLHPGPYTMSPYLSPTLGRPTEGHPSSQFTPALGPPQRNSDSGHSSNYGHKRLIDKSGPSGSRLDSNLSNNNINSSSRFVAKQSSFMSDQPWHEPGPRNPLPPCFMDISDQRRQMEMTANLPSGITTSIISHEPQWGDTHGQGPQPSWFEPPAPPAPFKNKIKSKKKNQNQKKKKVASQENRVAIIPIDAMTSKFFEMTAEEENPVQPSQHEYRNRNDSSTAQENKPSPSRQQDRHHKKGNHKKTNCTVSRQYNFKSSKSNIHASTTGTFIGSNDKGKGASQHKKAKEPDASQDPPVLTIEDFPPLSSSHLPTASYAQIVLQNASAIGFEAAKETKWQPVAYDVTLKTQEEEPSVSPGDGVVEQHTKVPRVSGVYRDGGSASSTVALYKAPKESTLSPKPVLIPCISDKDDISFDPDSIGDASDTDTTTVATSTSTTLTLTTAAATTIATLKVKSAPASPVMSYASTLKRPHAYCNSASISEVEGKEERRSSQ